MDDLLPQFVIGCEELEPTIAWFCDSAGFRMAMLRPADDPSIAVLEGHGVLIRLERARPTGSSGLRIPVPELPSQPCLTAPNGTTVEFVLTSAPDTLPANDAVFVHDRVSTADFGVGRAGMHYRDLIPHRQGGRYIASHITIPVGGPVADYVHHHHIRFQMIFCHAGWADLVYEGQGPAFRMEAGDCVLQPPHIRHQVLHNSDEFEVVEVGSPAVHDTLRDHEMVLPTTTLDCEKDFGGQRFVWHRAAASEAGRWRFDGFSRTDFGFVAATAGLAEAGVVRACGADTVAPHVATDEFLFWFVRGGSAMIHRDGQSEAVDGRDSLTLAAGETYALTDVSDDFEFLEVRIPSG